MSEGGDIFSPVTPDHLLREAEIMTLRQMSSSLAAMTNEMTAHRSALGTIKEDLREMKVRQEQQTAMQETINDLTERLRKLETRSAQQDGAFSLVTFLKDFGPWLVSILVLIWSFFSRKPG